MEILSSRTLERSESRRVSRIANAATILRRQSVRSNRKTPRFAILQSARNRTFLRVISNAISSRVRPEGGERGQADRGGGRTTEGSWLAGDNALLCIPLPQRFPISICFLSSPVFRPRDTPSSPSSSAAHLAPRGDQMASPIRVIPNILFLFRNQISRRPSRSRRTFTILSFSRRGGTPTKILRSRKTRRGDSISIYADIK